MTTTNDDTDAPPLSWRLNAWLKAAGYPFSRPKLYGEIHAGRIDARKIGRSTIILTSPRDYFLSCPSVVRGRKRGAAA
jgi:hypothetical protein